MPDGQQTLGNIEPIEIQEEMERSFLDYAMSVIVSRALPDVRDGLKPVHRRILYGMLDAGLRPDRQHTKCSRVVGHVMGNYHPHGDSAIYDALARMVQAFSLRHPLVDGHGAFGSPDPESQPAAARYTECKLAPIAMQLLAGIDQDTVDFGPSYDGKTSEPLVLPARFPNLLVNGSQGIAVGMATNIPPHNLGEVIDATIHLIDNPEATPDDLMNFVKGPDFPTGALILGRSGSMDAYRTGRGSIRMRAGGRDRRGQDRRPHRRHRDPVPDVGRGHRAQDRRPREQPRDRRHPRAAQREREGQDEARGRAAQGRERARHVEQPLQAHADADQLRCEHAGAGRRRAPHAEPGRRAHRLRRTTRSKSSPGAPSSCCARRATARTSSRDSSARSM